MELPRGNDLRALGRMAYCLDAMAVGIQHEGAVIMRVIIWPQPWFAIVSPTIGKRRQVGRRRPLRGLELGSKDARREWAS